MSWGHTAVVAMTYIGPSVDLEMAGSFGDKKGWGGGHEQ